MAPAWIEVRPGVEGMEFLAVDGNIIVLTREAWERKDFQHENLARNWVELCRTIQECPEVHLSRRFPTRSRIYSMFFPSLVHEDGRAGPGYMIVVVDRTSDSVQSAYV